MKTLTLIFVLFSGLILAQSKDLTEKQALKIFLKSENRKALNIKKSDFKKYLKDAKCINKHYKVNLKDMPIFQVKKTENYIGFEHPQSIFGLGDTDFPKLKDNGKKIITCNVIKTY